MDSEAFDWSLVSTAYGPAVDVPELLERLHSPDAAQHSEAIADLWSGLCHQETVYTASAASVPYLVGIAREAPLTSSERQQVLALVAAIGRGEDTCWKGYTPWEVVEECAAAVEAVLPEIVAWALEGDLDARPWAIVLATYFPSRLRGSELDVTSLLPADADLARLVTDLIAGVDPDPALVAAVAARDEDTEDWLINGLADYSPTRQGRQVVWDLAEKALL